MRKFHTFASRVVSFCLLFALMLTTLPLTQIVNAYEASQISIDLVKSGAVDVMLVSKNTDFTTEQMQELETRLKSQLSGLDVNFVGLETKTTTETTISGTFQAKISFPELDIDTWVYFYSGNTELYHIWYGERYWSGQSFDQDSRYGGAEILTLDYSALPANCDKIVFKAHGFNTSQNTRFQLIRNNADNTQDIPVDVTRYVPYKTYVDFGTFNKVNGIWDFTSFDGTYVSGTKIVTIITSKTMTEILREATWRDEATHLVIDVDTLLDPSLTESGELTSRLIADNVYLQFWGTNTNQNSFTQYGQSFGKDANNIDKYN